MRVLKQHLPLSRRRASLFFGMHSGERTLALTEQKGIDGQGLLGETTEEKSQGEERRCNNGKLANTNFSKRKPE